MSRMERIYSIVGGLLCWSIQPALGHERWVLHSLIHPVNADIFRTPSWGMASVIIRTLIFFAFIATLWHWRGPIHSLIVRRTPECCRSFMRGPYAFIFDEAVEALWFQRLNQYLNKFAVRVPAIVLMYSAATQNLMMPSFPLGVEAPIFQFVQVALGLMILMELLLPIVGYGLLVLFGYTLFAYSPVVSVDALPLLALAYVYFTMPSRSRSRALIIRHTQVRWMRIIVGLSFAMLGIMKIVNFELIIGVSDHAPVIMSDPLIKLFWWGTDPQFAREWWAFGFGMAEILTGALLIAGMFKRIISLSVSLVFAKLMIWDMGWPEIPHLYPISVLMIICFSNIAAPEDLGLQRRTSDRKRSEAAQAGSPGIAAEVAELRVAHHRRRTNLTPSIEGCAGGE